MSLDIQPQMADMKTRDRDLRPFCMIDYGHTPSPDCLLRLGPDRTYREPVSEYSDYKFSTQCIPFLVCLKMHSI
ncbi:hypothetical protein BaRGS_00034425 [Batillaria attramentaria]|uniref:Uncharacterized protein n=1 Tax=Batillaria attramentaria TaxID=370345 RepID=A0ABD0JIX0_9CAEN